MAPRYELAVGMKRGHKTTKIERVGKVSGKELSAKSEKLRQARTKGVSNIKYNY
jgi:large subunit ribosomal protein L36e